MRFSDLALAKARLLERTKTPKAVKELFNTDNMTIPVCFDTEDTAKILSCSVSTLKKMRSKDEGPCYARIGKRSFIQLLNLNGTSKQLRFTCIKHQ